jgi:hypothetical protein
VLRYLVRYVFRVAIIERMPPITTPSASLESPWRPTLLPRVQSNRVSPAASRLRNSYFVSLALASLDHAGIMVPALGEPAQVPDDRRRCELDLRRAALALPNRRPQSARASQGRHATICDGTAEPTGGSSR